MNLFLMIAYVLLTLLCISSLFTHVESPIIAMEDKWFSSFIIILLFFIVNTICNIVCSTWNNKRLLVPFYFIVLVSCFALSIYGILQYLNNCSIVGSFDNTTGFAASLSAGFPTLFYIYKYHQLRLIKWSVAFIGLCIAVVVVVSASRAGILSIVIICFLWFLKNRNIRFRKRTLVLISIFLLVLIIILYFYKKDSADGRLLIWQCTGQMIKDNLLWGYGHGGFLANYMNYQADYFRQNPDSKYVILAGNVKHPFNEYMLLVVNYGIVGLFLLCAFVYFLWKCYRRNPCLETNIAVICLAGIAVFACFSYPLSYPFVWVMMFCSVYIIISHAGFQMDVSKYLRKKMYMLIISLLLIVLVCTTRHALYTIAWSSVAKVALRKQTDITFVQYDRLLPKFRNNYLFLYNYAAELNYGGYYNQSQEIAEQCNKLWADYDLQLLMADNCIKSNQYSKAENYLKLASQMCPVRFIPLYELMELYRLGGEEEKAIQMAEKILKKPVKISSLQVKRIIERATEYVGLNIVN